MAPVTSLSSILSTVLLSTSLTSMVVPGAWASPVFAVDAGDSPSFVTRLLQAAGKVSARGLLGTDNSNVLDARDANPSVLAPRQGGTFAITGNQAGGVQPRLKIQDLQNDGDAWNIFLLAIQRMQQAPQSDQLSYYQLSAIHGRPLVPWDGVNGRPDAQNGYCTHTSNLFPTWHRPYLALFEQVLGYAALDVANEFADKDRWTSAAQRLRLPYLDWAAAPPSGQSVFPPSISQSQVSVTQPDGSTATIPNPLYQYQFQTSPPSELFYTPWNTEPRTLRWPNGEDANAQSQDNLPSQQMDGNRISARDRVYNLLTQYPDYANFSNEAWISDMPPGGNYDSIESVHDAIHGIIGGDHFGHMTYLDVAAFDPVFWMHHAMVDRIVAIWQALYPNTWTQAQTQKGSTFTYAAGSVQDGNSPLTPFHSDSNGNFWTSNSVRDISQFGYTYPELANGANDQSIRAAVNSLYGPSNARNFLKKRTVTDSVPFERNYEWLANIRAHKNVCNDTLFVHLFVGNHSENAADWFTDPNSVGIHTIFARRTPTDFHVTGTLPLTTALVDKVESGELKSLCPSDVKKYLKENLDWTVSKADGTALPEDHYPHIKISIVSSEVKPAATKYDFPQWVGDFSIHDDLTSGKLGGFSLGDILPTKAFSTPAGLPVPR